MADEGENEVEATSVGEAAAVDEGVSSVADTEKHTNQQGANANLAATTTISATAGADDDPATMSAPPTMREEDANGEAAGGEGSAAPPLTIREEDEEDDLHLLTTALFVASSSEEVVVVPMSHVHPPQAGHRADDVSSLQHTANVVAGNDNKHHSGNTRNNEDREQGSAIFEEEESGAYYYDDDDEEEQAKALQRRNMLIIIMLLLFLGLVVAIGAGVTLAVKNSSSGTPDNNNEVMEQPRDEGNATAADDEFFFRTSVPSSYPSEEGPCIPLEIGIIFDEYPGETGWMLLLEGNENDDEDDPTASNDAAAAVVWKSKYYNPLEYDGNADTFAKCFPPGNYTFVFTDREGDGICCYHGEGRYVLSSEGAVVTVGGPMDSEEEGVAFELPFVRPEAADEDGDGRDDRSGSIMPYDVTTRDANLTEGEDCENFRLVIMTDEYGVETTWELFEGPDKSGTLIADGGPYGSEYTYVVDYCLASPRVYTLYMYDWDRRGLCCATGEGWYKLTSGDVVILEKNGVFGEVNVTTFALPADGSAAFTDDPTQSPTDEGGVIPLGAKTMYPTVSPTVSPATGKPTVSPSASQTEVLTVPPTKLPTNEPTAAPTAAPTKPDQLDATAMDKEITPFPSLSPVKIAASPEDKKEDDKKNEDKPEKDGAEQTRR